MTSIHPFHPLQAAKSRATSPSATSLLYHLFIPLYPHPTCPLPNPSVHHGASPASAPCLRNPGTRSHLQDSPSLAGLFCDRVSPAVYGASLRRLPTLPRSCPLLGDDAAPRDRPQAKPMSDSRSAGPRAGFGAGAVGWLRGGCRWTRVGCGVRRRGAGMRSAMSGDDG